MISQAIDMFSFFRSKPMAKRNQRMEYLVTKIAELASQDTEMKTFGAASWGSGHGYQLKPCLAIADLVRFQSEYDVKLPQDYADFLTQIGDGGTGPYYGLFSLMESITDHPEHKCRAFLASPFPLTGFFNPDEHDETDSEDEIIGDPHICGSVALAHQGCGYYDRLVITGPQSGQVWTDGRCSGQGIAPLNCDFFTWYDVWLADALNDLGKLD